MGILKSVLDDINKGKKNLAITGTAVGAGTLYTPESEATMIGQMAKTFNKEALVVAEKMELDGAPMEAIRKTTGYQFGTPTHRGVDGKWRQEISDVDAKLNSPDDLKAMADEELLRIKGEAEYLKGLRKESKAPQIDAFQKEKNTVIKARADELKKADNVLNSHYGLKSDPSFTGNLAKYAFPHNELYSAYPDLGRNTIRQTQFDSDFYGSYDGVGTIDINKTAPDRKSTGLHESQHAVQDKEGFARGGVPDYLPSEALDSIVKDFEKEFGHLPAVKEKKGNLGEREYKEWARDMYASSKPRGMHDLAYEYYRKLAGEEEARQTQKRLGLSMKDRIDRNPNLDFDAPPSQQIVTGQKGQATPKALGVTAGLGLIGGAIKKGLNSIEQNPQQELQNSAYDYAIASPLQAVDFAGGIVSSGLPGGKEFYNSTIGKGLSGYTDMRSGAGKTIDVMIGEAIDKGMMTASEGASYLKSIVDTYSEQR